jgi:hypothetical protein
MRPVPKENLPRKIVVYLDGPNVQDMAYYFEGCDEAFGIREFAWGTPTREFLEKVEGVIQGLEYVVGQVVDGDHVVSTENPENPKNP